MAAQDIMKLYLLDLISDEEFCILLHFQQQNVDQKPIKKFNLDKLSDSYCKRTFRFTKNEILRLVACFGLDGQFKSSQRYIFTGVEGLCILLQRLSYPCRLYSVGKIFGRGQTAISSIFNWVLNHINFNFSYLLEDLNQPWLSRGKLFQFSSAVDEAGSPVANIWGFIDGTARDICRPIRNQRQYYSGHKRKHCVKYQAIMCPNGIIARLDGPFIGRRHDSFILELSKLIPEIENCQKLQLSNNGNFHLYGDTGCVNTKYILTNFRNPLDNSTEMDFNKRMAELRVVVEWGFGRVATLFSFVDFKKNQKLLLQPVSKYYRVATILTNCHVCLNGGQVGEYFTLVPPLLEEYLIK